MRQIDKITNTFGESCLKGYKLQRFTEIMEKIPSDVAEKIVNDIIDSQKQFPTLKEINGMVYSWKLSNQVREVREAKPYVVQCQKCFDTGFVFLKVNPTAKTVCCFCSCDQGNDKQVNKQPESKMPQLDDSLLRMGMKIQNFPVESFIPSQKDQNATKFSEKIQEPLERWLKFLNMSREYWSGQQIAKDLNYQPENPPI